MPDAAGVAFVIEGFCTADVKLLGPDHAYVAPAIDVAVKLRVLP